MTSLNSLHQSSYQNLQTRTNSSTLVLIANVKVFRKLNKILFTYEAQ